MADPAMGLLRALAERCVRLLVKGAANLAADGRKRSRPMVRRRNAPRRAARLT